MGLVGGVRFEMSAMSSIAWMFLANDQGRGAAAKHPTP